MKNKIEYYFGIDFGTTNSAAIAMRRYKNIDSYIKLSDDYGNPFPSLIAINKENGEIYCGRKVWRERRALQETCEIITSIKSYLDDDEKTWKVNDKEWTPKDLTTELLKSIKEHIEERLGNGETIDEASISIPVGFSSKKRKVLREAAKDAGIEVKNFITESTAVVFKNYNKLQHHKNIVVFDWGGGTLDISVVENNKGKIKELSINGIKIGGDDIDLEIAKWIHKKIMKERDIKITFEDMDAKDQDKMIVVSERAKKELGKTDVISISISNYGEYGYVRMVLDIVEFTHLLEKNIKKTMECLDEAILNSGLRPDDIDCIVMVGGSSYLIPLQEEMENRFENIDIEYPEDAVWNVAKGALLLGLNSGEVKLNQDIGLVLSDNSVFSLLKKDEGVEEIKEFLFGITEKTEQARFIFTDSKNTLGYLTVPTSGSLDEVIECSSYIDNNLIFRMDIKSNNANEENVINFTYDKLKFYYDISQIDNNIYKKLEEEGL